MLLRIKTKATNPFLRIVCAYGLQNLDGDHVFGFRKRLAQRHGAFKGAVVVLWLPGLSACSTRVKKQGHVVDHRGGRESFVQSR